MQISAGHWRKRWFGNAIWFCKRRRAVTEICIVGTPESCRPIEYGSAEEVLVYRQRRDVLSLGDCKYSSVCRLALEVLCLVVLFPCHPIASRKLRP